MVRLTNPDTAARKIRPMMARQIIRVVGLYASDVDPLLPRIGLNEDGPAKEMLERVLVAVVIEAGVERIVMEVIAGGSELDENNELERERGDGNEEVGTVFGICWVES